MRRTAEDTEKTRQLLLETALLSFAQKGWQGVTFIGVAQQAGLSRGAVHHHFRSKEDLLAGVLEWGWSHYGSVLVRSAPQAEPQVWLTGLISGFITLLRDDLRFRSLISVTVLVAPHSGLSQDQKHQALDTWRAEVADVASRAHTLLGPQTIGSLTLVLLQGLTLTAATRPEDLPKAADHDAVVAAMVTALLS